jgi:hypothetical protein
MSQNAFGSFDDASVNDAITLSVAAWPDNLGQDKKLATYLHNSGWTLKSLSGFQPDSYGYYTNENAAAFAATKGDTLAISIRGVDQPSSPLNLSQDVTFAQDLVAAPDPIPYYNRLIHFINAAITYANGEPSIKKILITGASLGGEIADLWATNPQSTPLEQLLINQDPLLPNSLIQVPLNQEALGSKFSTSNVSVITFGSLGIPFNFADRPLQARVLDLHNSTDPVYNHKGLTGSNATLLSSLDRFLTHKSGQQGNLSTEKSFYTPKVSDSTFLPHNPILYQAEINTLTSSVVFNSATAQTIFVFDYNNDKSISPSDVVDVNDATLGIPKGPHFLVGLGGSDKLVGDPSNNLIEAVTGTHVLIGGGGGDQFQIVQDSDTITNFDPKVDSLWLPPPISGKFDGHNTVLEYSGGTVTLPDVDFGRGSEFVIAGGKIS